MNDKFKKWLLGIGAFFTLLVGGASAQKLGALNISLNERTVLNAVVATTTGSAFNVGGSKLLGWTVATANGVSGTLKFACSKQTTAPDFSGTASTSGRWGYVNVLDSNSNANIAGDTGLVFTNSTTVRQFIISNANFKWCTAILSPWTNGTTTVTLLPGDNQ